MIKLLQNTKIRGAILATAAALSMSISMSMAKQLDHDIPTSLVVFIRSSFGLLFFIPLLIKNKSQIIKTRQMHLHILRVVIVVGSMLCTYYTYRHLPIAFATSIGMTGALFTTILSAIILKDKIGMHKWLLLIIGYSGVILVIRPQSFILDVAIIASLMANIFAALAIIISKIISRHDSTLTIMLYSNIGITLVSALFNSYTAGWHLDMLYTKDILILLSTGFFGITTQLCSLTALKYSSPSFLAPFEYTRMFWAVLIGLVVFSEIPNIYVILGSIIIICSTYFLTYLECNTSR